MSLTLNYCDDNDIAMIVKRNYEYVNVETISPAQSATGLYTTSYLSLQFSQAIDQTTFPKSFSISSDLGTISSSNYNTSWSGDSKSVILSPVDKNNPSLLINKIYTINLNTNLRSTTGNPLNGNYSSSFATGSFGGDAVAPTLSSHCINANSSSTCTGIGGSTFYNFSSIDFTFSEPMIPITVNSAISFTLGGNAVSPSSIVWSNYNAKVTYNFTGLPDGTMVLNLNTNALDGSGNALAGGSVITNETFTIATPSSGNTVATPTFSVAGGTYNANQSVTLSTTTGGASIRYTTNGTTPTCSTGTVYSSAISVTSTQTINAIGCLSGYADSTVATATYTLQVATPTFSPVGGTYTSTQSVTLSTTTGGANIRYTTNGTTPTCSSTLYSTPISVSTSQTINAIGCLAGYSDSAVGSAVYTMNISGAYITQWGSVGAGTGQFAYPFGIAVDSSGNIYVADNNNNRIQKFSSSGAYITQWGSLGAGTGQFNYPFGIAIDTSGNIYVADRNNHRIQKFTSSGAYITQWGSLGTGTGQFNYPYGVAVDSSDNIYVTDYNNHRIQKFTSSGGYLTQWGSVGTGTGQFTNPTGVAVDSSGNIYVADYGNDRIQKFTSSGAYLILWGTFGSGNGQFYWPFGVAVDSSGNIYVADYGNHRIQKLNSSGTFVGWLGCGSLTGWQTGACSTFGSGNGQFYFPAGVALDSSGNIYVADTYNHRVQKFAP